MISLTSSPRWVTAHSRNSATLTRWPLKVAVPFSAANWRSPARIWFSRLVMVRFWISRLALRRRSESTRIIFRAKSGLRSIMDRNRGSFITSMRQALVATAVAERGLFSIRAISPNTSPGLKLLRVLAVLAVVRLRISTAPWMMMNMWSPGSPSLKITCPGS